VRWGGGVPGVELRSNPRLPSDAPSGRAFVGRTRWTPKLCGVTSFCATLVLNRAGGRSPADACVHCGCLKSPLVSIDRWLTSTEAAPRGSIRFAQPKPHPAADSRFENQHRPRAKPPGPGTSSPKGFQRVAGGSAAAVPPERVPEHGQNPERGSRGSGCIVPRTESEAVSPQPVDRRREGSLVRVTCAIAESRVEFLAIQRTTSDYLRRHHFPVMSTSDGRESPASAEVVSLVPRAERRVFQRVEIRSRHQGPHPSLCMALSATDSKPIVRVTPVRALGRGLSVSFFPVSPATSLR
jgi:hypothetical protein